MEVIVNGRAVPKAEAAAVLLDVSNRLRARQPRPRIDRLPDAPERRSVARAILAVETRIVAAFWVLDRSTSNPCPKHPSRHGIGYPLEREDKWAAAVAGGGWLSQEPPAPPPSAQEIDAADEPMEWLALLEKEQAAIVAAGARSKQGDVMRKVNWRRVRNQFPHLDHWSSDRLSRVYRAGLRTIAFGVAS